MVYSLILNLIVSSLLFRLLLNKIIGHILLVMWLHEMLFRVSVSVSKGKLRLIRPDSPCGLCCHLSLSDFRIQTVQNWKCSTLCSPDICESGCIQDSGNLNPLQRESPLFNTVGTKKAC